MHLLLYACFLLVLPQQTTAEYFEECKTEYVCYVRAPGPPNDPEMALRQNFGEFVNPSISDALVKIHAYSDKHYKVILQSLKDDVTSIEFSRKEDNVVTPLFSCSNVTSNAAEFKAEITVETNTIRTQEPVVPAEITNSFENKRLKCEVELKHAKPIIERKILMLSLLTLKVGGIETAALTPTTQELLLFCDPKQLKFKNEKIVKTKAYKKVNVHLNNVFCGDKNTGDKDEEVFGIYKHKFEYRPDDASEYVAVDKISCTKDGHNGRKFELKLKSGGTVKLDKDKKYNVRCVADANLFCDYDPKYPKDLPNDKTSPLERTQPNITAIPPIPSRISCPSTHKYFVIQGKPPDKTAEIECHNFETTPMWTVNNTKLTPAGPTVYCTNELECGKIPNNLLNGSFLNAQGLPSCHEGGTIEIRKVTGGATVTAYEIKCEKKSGQLMHRHTANSDVWIGWTGPDQHHVTCNYPNNKEQMAQRAHEIVKNAMLTGIIVFVVASVFGALFLFYIYVRNKKEADRVRKADQEESKRFDKELKEKKNESSGGGEKSSNKSSAGPTSKSKADGPQSNTTNKERRKGIFPPENGETIVMEPPKHNIEQLKQSLEQGKRTKYRNDTFPEGYKCVYKEEARERLEKQIKKCEVEMNKIKFGIRAVKAKEMAKGAEPKK